MNVYKARQELKTKRISDLKLRVVYYARVSTEKVEQKLSVEHQQTHFEELIKNNPKWELVGYYIDDGVSGIKAEKRGQFQQMILDSQKDKFDLVVTKEISRFARNTLDSIKYTRELLSNGVAVWFENDNINTIDEDSEFRLTIMAGIAQDEIRKLSSRVRFGHAQSIKKGVVMGNSRIYGYTKQDGKLKIDEDEAVMIRDIFEKYASGDWSTTKIENYLYEMGYRNHKGGKISSNVIKHIIVNPKYKGYYAGGKVKIVDMFTKKQEFLPPSEWVQFKDETGEIVPAIVSEELWDLANRWYQDRSQMIKSRRTSYKSNNTFKGKIICGKDGSVYWMKQRTSRGKNNPYWKCSCKTDGKCCSSPPIKEEELKQAISYILNESSNNLDDIIEQYKSFYNQTLDSSQNSEKESLNGLIEKKKYIITKKNKILDYNVQGLITDEEFISRNNDFNKQLQEIDKEINELSFEVSNRDIDKEANDLERILRECAEVKKEDINYSFVQRYIEKIIIFSSDKGDKDKKRKIDVYLNKYGTSEETEDELRHSIATGSSGQYHVHNIAQMTLSFNHFVNKYIDKVVEFLINLIA